MTVKDFVLAAVSTIIGVNNYLKSGGTMQFRN